MQVCQSATIHITQVCQPTLHKLYRCVSVLHHRICRCVSLHCTNYAGVSVCCNTEYACVLAYTIQTCRCVTVLQHRICRCVSPHNANYADEGQFFTEQTNNSCHSATNSAEVCDYVSVHIRERLFTYFIYLLFNGDSFFI